MIHVDETDPVGDLEQCFAPRDVVIKRGVDAKDAYEMVTEIGRGKFGTVYRCREKATGLQLAAKFVPIPKREDRRNVEREVELMNALQHSLIIQLYDAFEHQKMMCVVLELVDGGELFDRVIDDDFVLTERACAVFVRQVCQAMEFVHRNNIIHLDLKPENILCLTREGNRIKIIDFGLARKFDPDKKLQVLFGTPEFVAPEVVNFDQISFGTDMWSVGVICYVLLSGLSPFMGNTDVETMANVTIGKYDFDDEAFVAVSKDALDFISKLLVKDSGTRMTAAQCLTHKWLKQRRTSNAKNKSTKHKVSGGVQAPDDQHQVRRKGSTSSSTGSVADTVALAEDAATAAATDKKATPSNGNNGHHQGSDVPAISGSSNGTAVDATTTTTNNNGHCNINVHTKGNAGTNDAGTAAATVVANGGGAVVVGASAAAPNNGNEDGTTELTTTKDNLKSFIERWEEHPNSPYVFDINTNCIAPVATMTAATAAASNGGNVVLDTMAGARAAAATSSAGNNGNGSSAGSVLSSRGCSPASTQPPLPNSPPPTITRPNNKPSHHPATATASVVPIQPKAYERRHSDNLADEIKRLSERLHAMSTTSTQKAAKNDNRCNSDHHRPDEAGGVVTAKPQLKTKPAYLQNRTQPTVAEQFAQQLAAHTEQMQTRRNGVQQQQQQQIPWRTNPERRFVNSSSSSTTTITQNGHSYVSNSTTTTTSSIRSGFQRASSVASTAFNDMASSKALLRSERLSARLQLLNDMPSIIGKRQSDRWNRAPSLAASSSVHRSIDTGDDETSGAFYGQSTQQRRIKFRVSQLSRDVPIGLPDTHRTVFLEEAVSTTKDCLRNLLDKYGGGDGVNGGSVNGVNGVNGVNRVTEMRSAFGRHGGRQPSVGLAEGCNGSAGKTNGVEQRSQNSLNFFFQRHAVAGNSVRQMQAQLESKRQM